MFRHTSALAASLAALTLTLGACQSGTTPASPSEPAPASSSTESQPTSSPASPSQSSSTEKPSSGDSDLASKLLDGEVSEFTFAAQSNPAPMTELQSPYFESEEYDITPADCDKTGIEDLVAVAEGSGTQQFARVALGTGTDSPQKHQEYAERCETVTGTVNETEIYRAYKVEAAPQVEGASDVVMTSRTDAAPNTDDDGVTSYLITGNVGDTNVVVFLLPSDGTQNVSPETATEIFQAQVDKLKE
ncbi:MAG: hypothetical protein Q4D79_05865 [Propionibacteriaceae bacterium]|nr:hypothetical protein [Propionibacteriaceae bacterium]